MKFCRLSIRRCIEGDFFRIVKVLCVLAYCFSTAHVAANPANSTHACNELLSSVAPKSASPKFHIGNFDPNYLNRKQLFGWNGMKVPVLGRLVQFEGRPEYWKISRISRDGSLIECRSVLGDRRWFSVLKDPRYDFLVVDYIETLTSPLPDSEWVTSPAAQAKVKGESRPIKVWTDRLQESSELLSSSQEKASMTAKISDKRVRLNLLDANLKMLRLLDSGRNLNLSDLESWNLSVNYEMLEGWRGHASGISRGKRSIIHSSRGDILVDLTQYQVAALIGGSTVGFEFLPADMVQTRLERLVEQVNNLNENTTDQSLAAVYREFITIHPFCDGNGRTARILLDFALIKTGRSPILHEGDDTREVLFKSLDKLAVDLFGSN